MSRKKSGGHNYLPQNNPVYYNSPQKNNSGYYNPPPINNPVYYNSPPQSNSGYYNSPPQSNSFNANSENDKETAIRAFSKSFQSLSGPGVPITLAALRNYHSNKDELKTQWKTIESKFLKEVNQVSSNSNAKWIWKEFITHISQQLANDIVKFRNDLDESLKKVCKVDSAPCAVECLSSGSTSITSDIDVTVKGDCIYENLVQLLKLHQLLKDVFSSSKIFVVNKQVVLSKVFIFFDINFYLSNFALLKDTKHDPHNLSSYFLSTDYDVQLSYAKSFQHEQFADEQSRLATYNALVNELNTLHNDLQGKKYKFAIQDFTNSLVDIISQIAFLEDECYVTQGSFFHVVKHLQQGMLFNDSKYYPTTWNNMMCCSIMENLNFAVSHVSSRGKYMIRVYDAIGKFEEDISTQRMYHRLSNILYGNDVWKQHYQNINEGIEQEILLMNKKADIRSAKNEQQKNLLKKELEQLKDDYEVIKKKLTLLLSGSEESLKTMQTDMIKAIETNFIEITSDKSRFRNRRPQRPQYEDEDEDGNYENTGIVQPVNPTNWKNSVNSQQPTLQPDFWNQHDRQHPNYWNHNVGQQHTQLAAQPFRFGGRSVNENIKKLTKNGSTVKKIVNGRERVVYEDASRKQYFKSKDEFVPITQTKTTTKTASKPSTKTTTQGRKKKTT